MLDDAPTPHLIEFAFESQMSPDANPEALLQLARQCWKYNTRMGISGRMHLKGDRFEQVIEGVCAVVQPLAARILADPRHGLIRIDRFGSLAARHFAGWSVVGLAPEAAGDAAAPAPALSGDNVRALASWRHPPPAELPRLATLRF
jgi:Sensors of blue-light using FAD